MLEDKYNMTREQNVFLAKRNIVDSIWKSSHIEGINVTFPETQRIYDGGNVARLRIDEIQTINNLKHAWIFILNSLNNKNDLNLLKSINALVGSNLIDSPGKMRTYDVGIGGTKWKPEIPNEEKLKNELENIKNSSTSVTDMSITMMCHLMRTQFFSDGNKRTSMLFANKIMIENGKGIISVPVDEDIKFNELLTDFYETNNMEKLKKFIYDDCLSGINIYKEKDINKNNDNEESEEDENDL